MYGIFTYIYHKNPPNVGKYASPMDAMGDVVSVQLISFLHDVFQHRKNGRPGDVPRRFFGRITSHVNGNSKLYINIPCVFPIISIHACGPPSYSDMKIQGVLRMVRESLQAANAANAATAQFIRIHSSHESCESRESCERCERCESCESCERCESCESCERCERCERCDISFKAFTAFVS